jgi:hypothetical protein
MRAAMTLRARRGTTWPGRRRRQIPVRGEHCVGRRGRDRPPSCQAVRQGQVSETPRTAALCSGDRKRSARLTWVARCGSRPPGKMFATDRCPSRPRTTVFAPTIATARPPRRDSTGNDPHVGASPAPTWGARRAGRSRGGADDAVRVGDGGAPGVADDRAKLVGGVDLEASKAARGCASIGRSRPLTCVRPTPPDTGRPAVTWASASRAATRSAAPRGRRVAPRRAGQPLISPGAPGRSVGARNLSRLPVR